MAPGYSTTPPSMMHEYQKEKHTELAIHNCLILNNMFLVVWEEQEPKNYYRREEKR